MSGVMLIVAGIAVVELWRRGYLNKAIASVSATAKAGADVRKREFHLPTSYLGSGGGGHLS